MDKYSAEIGPASDNKIEVKHGLGTEDVVVQAWEAEGARRKVVTSLAIKDADTVIISFSPPLRDRVRVVVLG